MSDGYKNKKISRNSSFIKKKKTKKKNLNIALEENFVYRFRHLREFAKSKGIDLTATLEKDIINFIKKAEEKFSITEEDWKSVKKCPKCGSELVVRNYKDKSFYGCSSYPKCNFTTSINDE